MPTSSIMECRSVGPKRRELGATMVEYALMVVLVAAVATAAVATLGDYTNELFSTTTDAMQSSGIGTTENE